MNRNIPRTLSGTGVGLLVSLSAGWAVLPQPDVIFYGAVTVNNVVVTDNMTVVARVTGIDEPVGEFTYGECIDDGGQVPCPPADRYLLSVLMESLADNPGQTPSLDAAQVGQTVDLYLKQGDGPETLAASIPLNDRGIVQNLNLPPNTGPTPTNTSDVLPTETPTPTITNTPRPAATPPMDLFDASNKWYDIPPEGIQPQDLIDFIESLHTP